MSSNSVCVHACIVCSIQNLEEIAGSTKPLYVLFAFDYVLLSATTSELI